MGFTGIHVVFYVVSSRVLGGLLFVFLGLDRDICVGLYGLRGRVSMKIWEYKSDQSKLMGYSMGYTRFYAGYPWVIHGFLDGFRWLDIGENVHQKIQVAARLF